MAISACEVFDCKTCGYMLRHRCLGCAEGNKLRQADSEEPCAIYHCVVSKGFTSCKECTAVCQFPRNLEMVCPVRCHFEKKRMYARKLSDHYVGRRQESADACPTPRVSEKTITRLRGYLYALDEFLSQGISKVSSEDIANKVGAKDYLIRHDLSQFGAFGRPSIGYDAVFLRSRLGKVLHLDKVQSIIWVGAAHLANDVALIERFGHHGFNVVGIFDTDPSRFANEINGMEIEPLENVPEMMRGLGVEGAVLAVSQDEAQDVADLLIAAGIRGILNLTSAIITVPPGICMRHVDVVAELISLSYYCHEMHQPEQPEEEMV